MRSACHSPFQHLVAGSSHPQIFLIFLFTAISKNAGSIKTVLQDPVPTDQIAKQWKHNMYHNMIQHGLKICTTVIVNCQRGFFHLVLLLLLLLFLLNIIIKLTTLKTFKTSQDTYNQCSSSKESALQNIPMSIQGTFHIKPAWHHPMQTKSWCVCGSDIKFNIRYHLQQNQDHWSTKEDGVTFLKAARI